MFFNKMKLHENSVKEEGGVGGRRELQLGKAREMENQDGQTNPPLLLLLAGSASEGRGQKRVN